MLGIRGEEIDLSAKKSLMAFGWNEEELEDLIDNEVGILLTFVLPGTPAAMAKLKPGDVLNVENVDIVTSNPLAKPACRMRVRAFARSNFR